MNAIMGFSDLLQDSNLDKKSEYLKNYKKIVETVWCLLLKIIEMSKIDVKQIMPNYKGLDIENCIVELYNAIKVTIPKDKDIQFYILENPKNS
jgi:hypothetical protein